MQVFLMQKTKFTNINLNKKRKGMSIILLAFSILAIIALSGFVIDLGILLNCRYELQKAVETTALASITDYEAYEDNANIIKYPAVNDISTDADSSVNNNLDAFKKSNSFLLMSGNITPVITFGTTAKSRYSRAIRVEASAVARTFFLNIIGIKSITLNASAVAAHVPVYLNDENILKGSGTYEDTLIRNPIAGISSSINVDGIIYALPTLTNINVMFNNIYGFPDGYALSLGPGGYITIKLPATLVNGKGFDLQIIERGNANGYFVYAGNDKNPTSPYVDAGNPGGDISWVNISCTGTPIGSLTNGKVGSYSQNIIGLPAQPKFYGSGYFDLGAKCVSPNGTVIYDGNVNTVKYLKIIDDNVEDGFTLKDPEYDTNLNAVPGFFPGQNSSLTPGASIDAIAVEHHSRLINANDFNVDTDNDGLIDVFETLLKLGSCGPSDGVQNCGAPPASKDAIKYWGYVSPGVNNIIQDSSTNALRIDYPTQTDNPPKMIINY
jgi:hypothetical protein